MRAVSFGYDYRIMTDPTPHYEFRHPDTNTDSEWAALIDNYLALFAASFPSTESKYSLDYLRWQYLDNPAGKVIATDAFLDGQLAAHYAVIPVRFGPVGQPGTLGALSMNTATHPDHRGRRLFPRLAKATYDHARDLGVQWITGVANENSVKGFVKKLDFAHLGHVGIAFGHASGFPIGLNAKDGIQHSENYIDWKLANPSVRYSLKAVGDSHLLVAHKRRFEFALQRFDHLTGRLLSLPRTSSLRPVFMPHFGFKVGRAVPVPKRIKPSPWHVIFRGLQAGHESPLERLVGLDMDTF